MATALSNPNTSYDEAASLDVSVLLPRQGEFSPADYLYLTENTRRLAELIDGRIEVLAMPTLEHQEIIFYLLTMLRAFITPNRLGRAIMAPIRMRLNADRYQEPDVLFMFDENTSRAGNEYWDRADLVMEVVSKEDPQRDWVDKRQDYAAAGIPEYWIIDPRTKTIIVLRLENKQYLVHSEAHATGLLTSALLPGFKVEAAAVFAAGQGM